jgi:hypothetical protein
MKLKGLTEEGVIMLICIVLGVLSLLMLFGCANNSRMSCDNLLGEEKDGCLQSITDSNNALRYRDEIEGYRR